MNTAQVEATLISLGYRFRKSHDKQSEKNVWYCVDQDNIPVASNHFRGELVRRVEKDLGGIEMTYLLQLQKAIAHTEQQECVDVAHKLPSGPTKSYWIGWELLEADLTYAMSLGEHCTRTHLSLWTDELPLENDEEVGYLDRVVKIKQLLEGVE